jgi:hypothetical protein
VHLQRSLLSTFNHLLDESSNLLEMAYGLTEYDYAAHDFEGIPEPEGRGRCPEHLKLPLPKLLREHNHSSKDTDTSSSGGFYRDTGESV